VVGLMFAYVNTTLSQQIVFNMHVQRSYLGYTKSWLGELL